MARTHRSSIDVSFVQLDHPVSRSLSPRLLFDAHPDVEEELVIEVLIRDARQRLSDGFVHGGATYAKLSPHSFELGVSGKVPLHLQWHVELDFRNLAHG